MNGTEALERLVLVCVDSNGNEQRGRLPQHECPSMLQKLVHLTWMHTLCGCIDGQSTHHRFKQNLWITVCDGV